MSHHEKHSQYQEAPVSDGEIGAMRALQWAGARGPVPGLARAYSAWGEHAAGWLLVGTVGACLDRKRRATWVRVSLSAFVAHAGAVVVKRVVRRRRPDDPRIKVLVRTPSDLSFPSAHAASTTAAMASLIPVIGAPAAGGAAASMSLARVLLGVHYPTDVIAGATLGLATALIIRRLPPLGA